MRERAVQFVSFVFRKHVTQHRLHPVCHGYNNLLHTVNNKVIYRINRYIFKCGQKRQNDCIRIAEYNSCDVLSKPVPFLFYRFARKLNFMINLIFSFCDNRKKHRLCKENKRGSQFDDLN